MLAQGRRPSDTAAMRMARATSRWVSALSCDVRSVLTAVEPHLIIFTAGQRESVGPVLDRTRWTMMVGSGTGRRPDGYPHISPR